MSGAKRNEANKAKETGARTPGENDSNEPEKNDSDTNRRIDPRFAPGARHEGMRARAVGRLVEEALFGAGLRSLTLQIALESDFLHVTATALDALPEDRERAPYDD